MQIPFIAVGICRTSFGNTHTGVAYRHSTSDEVRLFHQAWHHATIDGPLAVESEKTGGPFFCVVPRMEPERAQAIAGFWEMIASRNEQIAYALRDDTEALFDENTGRLTMPNGRGLNCSTFVMVLFRSVRFPYIDTANWPVECPGDAEAYQNLIDLLEKTGADATISRESAPKSVPPACGLKRSLAQVCSRLSLLVILKQRTPDFSFVKDFAFWPRIAKV